MRTAAFLAVFLFLKIVALKDSMAGCLSCIAGCYEYFFERDDLLVFPRQLGSSIDLV